ncbi:MAG: hypothetical protein AAFN10_10250 [Bacteroidota bacterium]
MQYELSHDTIARQVFDKASVEARTRRKVEKYIRERHEAFELRGAKLTQDDIDYISPYLEQVNIDAEIARFIEDGRSALIKKRIRANYLKGFLGIVAITLALVFGYLWQNAEKAKVKAEEETERAEKAEQDAIRQATIAKAIAWAAKARQSLTEGYPTQALNLAYAAYHADPNQETVSAFHDLSLFQDQSFQRKLKTEIHINAFAISPDGTQVVIGDQAGKPGHKGKEILLDLKSGEILRVFEGHSGEVSAIAFSPDGKQIISGGKDKKIILWDIEAGQQLQTFTGHSAKLTALCFSPDAKRILSGSERSEVLLWDIESGQQIRSFVGHESFVNSLVFSPKGIIRRSYHLK